MASYDDQTLRQLLDLQGEDSAIVRLQERRSSLPEAARLAEVREQLAELEADLAIARKQQGEIAREQSRLEGEIELIDQKAAREDQRMMSGKVANPKELSALQAEIAGLQRKRGTVEDQLLEVMVQADAATALVEKLDGERSQAQSEADELSAEVARLSGDIDVELKEHAAKRDEAATPLPPDLLALYEKIRASKHGVGAAALRGGTCEGCHTKLPAVEAERIRKEKGLQRCDNCRRILVVT
ncbi:MAG: C4-type zinc ribbon domain-containing protein [Actinomycetota bacterium]|nr:C4-type zinc ribbon domain-containing protein [Actinomycetota bacterium]